jgi:hypothetical protein
MGFAAALTTFTAGCWVALATAGFAEPIAVARQDCSRGVPPTIGMTAEQLLASCWGAPKGVLKTTRVTGTVEHFFYKRGTATITNGKITEILEAR